MIDQTITISGLVATTPRHLETADGLEITSFRVASGTQKYDRATNTYRDGETNWYTITAFRSLAVNAKNSISKGDRIIVSGKLRVRDWDNGERSGTSVEIEANLIGHDLSFGTSKFERVVFSKDPEPVSASVDLTAE